MKHAFLALVFSAQLLSLGGCAHQGASPEAVAIRSLASAGTVYLDTTSVASEQQDTLLAVAEGRRRISPAETTSLIKRYAESAELQTILKSYASELYRTLAINPEKPKAWIEKNAEFYKGITNYVGSSDESMDDEGPSWQSINIQLRSGKKMAREEKKFLDEILSSLAQLPVASGLAFRGMSMDKARFDKIPAKGPWPQPAFTSTSLDPSVALGFGNGFEGYSQTGVMILKLKRGYPVSPLTFDHGRMGQPGRFEEYELLLPPGRTLIVHAKLEDTAAKTYYVFAEEK